MMKKWIAIVMIAALALCGTALAATYTDRDGELTFEYDDTLFDVVTEEETDDELLVTLTGKDPSWGVTQINIYLAELNENESFPKVEEFTGVEEETGHLPTQGDWANFEDVIMFSSLLKDGTTESVFIAPIYDGDHEVEQSLTVRVSVSEVDSVVRSDAISDVLDTLKVVDD